MSTSTALCEQALCEQAICDQTLVTRSHPLSVARLLDYLELTKPKIAVLELLTVLAAGCLASWSTANLATLLHAMLGTALVAGSASACNQWLERKLDALMPRTAERPLPAGRLSSAEVAWFAVITGAAGVLYLAAAVNLLTAMLGLVSWVMYVCVYTPLKPRSTMNTLVGAVAGGLPILMGWAAVEGRFGAAALALFLIVFLWQFPHFMAIAWLYRRQYEAAGMKMLTVVDPSGQLAGLQAVCSAMLLIPVSLLPSVVDFAGTAYFMTALALGTAQLLCAIVFCWRRNETTARVLLRASLVYLPVLMLVMILGPMR
jgi:protoheme IX farnesyltransferase